MRRALLVLALVACGTKTTTPVTPIVIAAHQDFPDNALVEFAPADTPYAFASFKSFPLEAIRKMSAILGPVWRRSFVKELGSRDRAQAKMILDALDHLDVAEFDKLGFSSKMRFALYGLGVYPVVRAEIGNGDRVFELAQRAAATWNQALPPPTERGGRRYWLIPIRDPELTVAVVIAPKEVVLAVAPRAVIDAHLEEILGERHPSAHLTTATFRALAERDRFSGLGLGFVDLPHLGAVLAADRPAACRAAIDRLGASTPRVAFGYGEFDAHRMDFGMVLELDSDASAAAHRLTIPLAGIERVIADKPAMAFAAAVDLDHARELSGRVATVIEAVGTSCQVPALVDNATGLRNVSASALPSVLEGLQGGYVVLDKIELDVGGSPKTIEGYGMMQFETTKPILAIAGGQLPGFELHPDRTAVALPPIIPFPGHVAASETAIALALGPDSEHLAVVPLDDKPAPAPLALIALDYAKLGSLLANKHDEDSEYQRAIMKAFGTATVEFLVDPRGLVTWMSLDLR